MRYGGWIQIVTLANKIYFQPFSESSFYRQYISFIVIICIIRFDIPRASKCWVWIYNFLHSSSKTKSLRVKLEPTRERCFHVQLRTFPLPTSSQASYHKALSMLKYFCGRSAVPPSNTNAHTHTYLGLVVFILIIRACKAEIKICYFSQILQSYRQ